MFNFDKERRIGKFIEEEDEDEDFISSIKDYSVSYCWLVFFVINPYTPIQHQDDNSLRILRNNIYEEESNAQSLGKIQNQIRMNR